MEKQTNYDKIDPVELTAAILTVIAISVVVYAIMSDWPCLG